MGFFKNKLCAWIGVNFLPRSIFWQHIVREMFLYILPDLPHDYNCDHQNYTRVLFYLKMLNNSRKYLHMLINWCTVKQLVHQVVITLYICYICCFSVAGPKGGLRGLHPPPFENGGKGEEGEEKERKKRRKERRRGREIVWNKIGQD